MVLMRLKQDGCELLSDFVSLTLSHNVVCFENLH